MASQFQNRLLGTVLLVAVGVIILPSILDGEKTNHKEDVVSIPIKPNAMDIENQDPTSTPKTLDEIGSEEVYEIVNTPSSDIPVPEQPQFQGNGWVIQLMSLRNKENALKLVADLKKRGYVAKVEDSEEGMVRIVIGPDLSKEKLEKQIVELEKITGSKGQLRTFKM